MATVFVVYVEYNKAEEPYVVGVAATREIAEQLVAKEKEQHTEWGNTIWGDDESEDIDWDVDFHIEEHTVQEQVWASAPPVANFEHVAGKVERA